MSEENNCFFVSSRGILKSCDVRSLIPISSINILKNYNSLTQNNNNIQVLYVCGTAINFFATNIIDTLKFNFVLVSGDCDETIPNDVLSHEQFIKFISNPKLVHWYSQNCVLLTHNKLSQIPIGLDYHTMAKNNHEWGNKTCSIDQEHCLMSVIKQSKPFYEREIKAYANFHFSMGTKHSYDRKEAFTQIPNDLVYYEPHKVKRLDTWMKQSQYAFVISPHGGGFDCHRTWEALALGCIPIVKTSNLDSLYSDLPVLIVKKWSDVNNSLLELTVNSFRNKKFNMEKLTLKYWIAIIKKDVLNCNLNLS